MKIKCEMDLIVYWAFFEHPDEALVVRAVFPRTLVCCFGDDMAPPLHLHLGISMR